MRSHYFFAVGFVIFILIVLGVVFYTAGDPLTVGNRKHDDAILNEFSSIESAVNTYYTKYGKLPESFDDIKEDFAYIGNQDQQLGKFEYKKGMGREYSLCATFKTNSADDVRETPSRLLRNDPKGDQKNLTHVIGYDCLEYTALSQAETMPYSFDSLKSLNFPITGEGYCTKDNDIVVNWNEVTNATHYQIELYETDLEAEGVQGAYIDTRISGPNSKELSAKFSSPKIAKGKYYFSKITSMDSTGEYTDSVAARSSSFLCTDVDPLNKSASSSADRAVSSYPISCSQSGGVWKNNTCTYVNCEDPDVLDIYTKSSSRFTSSENSSTDYCSGDKLYEHSCSPQGHGSKEYFLQNQIFVCANGCKDGACIP